MSWDDLTAYICNLESEVSDLQRQLAQANDHIKYMEDTER